MEDSIKKFAEQFSFKPEVSNKENIKPWKNIIISGMGGSHLASDIIKKVKPELDIYIHKDYGVPDINSEKLNESFLIANSYSGNTEETFSFLKEAHERKLNVGAISTGGKILEYAKANNIPFIEFPDSGIQPRMAVGFSIMALATILSLKDLLAELSKLSTNFNPDVLESKGKEIADLIHGNVPIIYSSLKNECIAYNWKIKFNETAKIPSFYNVFPELNHNEMTGFDIIPNTSYLSEKFYFILLSDSDDSPLIRKRMEILRKLYADKDLNVTFVEILGDSKLHKIFNSIILADWVAIYTSRLYGTEPEKVPMIEDFKLKLQIEIDRNK
ncbi:MAG: bifunctional phosphoglucose/phosphomannose isomerase [Candidatus Paceibacterota bacterium]